MLIDRMTNGFTPLMQLQGEMNRLFENFFEDVPAARTFGAAYPSLNAWEDGDNAYVEAELPGMKMDEVEIYVAGREVTIGGERKIAQPDEVSWHRRERSQGRFARMLTLPWEVDADKVEATLSNGILSVKLPKSETCKPKKVKILTK